MRKKNPLMLIGGRAKGLEYTDPVVRTPIGLSRNESIIIFWHGRLGGKKGTLPNSSREKRKMPKI